MISKLKSIKKYKLYKTTLGNKFLYDNAGLVGKIPTTEQALKNIFQWIKESFKEGKDGGSSAYYSFESGWKSSYPETTGYLIPTLYDYSIYSKNNEWREIATKASDWLLSIQSKEGGWQGLQIGVKADLRVFNTAMILDGLIASYRIEQNEKYLDAATRGMKWTFDQMGEDGFFSKNNVSGGGSFDTLVLACLLMVIQFLNGDEKKNYIEKTKSSLDTHLTLQTENGWFNNCNFNERDTALLHHIGYTLDGLLISADILNDEKYYLAVKKTAQKLLANFEVNVELPAYTNPDWTTRKDLGSKASLCLTGLSQVAIVFQKIYKKENDLRYLNAALKINDIVSAIGNYKSGNSGLRYGLAGAYPVNGNYQPYKMVNWAAKYHAESVLLSLNACMPKNILS